MLPDYKYLYPMLFTPVGYIAFVYLLYAFLPFTALVVLVLYGYNRSKKELKKESGETITKKRASFARRLWNTIRKR